MLTILYSTKDKPTAVALPYNNRPLSLQELEAQEPLLAMYLDVQKQLSISDLDAREVKGRWKRFVHRW